MTRISKLTHSYLSGTILLMIFLSGYPGNARLQAQQAIGEWKSHLPYNAGRQTASTGNRIYCGTASGLYYYDKAYNTVHIMTKSDGLSDLEISALEYSPERGSLFIGYTNTNIDILEDGEIFNIPDIKRKQITANKTINNILILEDLAYLSCGFGIVVVNLEKKEIKDTYLIGENGGFINVHDIASDGVSLFAATESGVYQAALEGSNLVDFNSWNRIQDIPNAQGEFVAVEYFNDRLYTGWRNPAAEDDSLYYREAGSWKRFSLAEKNSLRHVSAEGDFLLVVTRLFSTTYNQQHEATHLVGTQNPVHGVRDQDGYWGADGDFGLFYSPAWEQKEFIKPDGPQSNGVASVVVAGDIIHTAAGAVRADWENTYRWMELNTLEAGMWTGLKTVDYRDLIHLNVDPGDKYHVFGSCYGSGIVEFRNGEVSDFYDPSNSTLQFVETTTICRIGGTVLDRSGNLWVTNGGVAEPISVRKPDGKWKSFQLDGQLKVAKLAGIINTYADHKWVICPLGHGLFAFDVAGTVDDISDDRYEKFDIINSNGKIITNNVFALAEDRDNNIWVGTDKGIVVYYSPTRVFQDDLFYGQQIIVPRNDGTGLADILLGTEKVTAIAVDGANRKWLGTEKSGVYLVSEDGLEEIHHFTQEDSPLLSNNITDITIDGETGLVYIGTDRGLISYKSTAIEGRENYSGVYVYPNPVRHDYRGDIVITGLVGNVNVKITDINGNLVYETTALGGQAIWDGRSFSGERVQTGVYMVFCTDEDGSKTHVTKLLVIN